MTQFPAEFADLLNNKGRAILERGPKSFRHAFHADETPFAHLTGILDRERAGRCRDILDQAMYKHLRRIEVPIPRESITEMSKSYEELLPKTMRFKTAYLNSRSSRAYLAASEIGLFSLLRSETLLRFAEIITGVKLARNPGQQVILYEAGDYAGPHNDHHPDNETIRDGYVDVHISLTNSGVSSQYLVCERGGHFSKQYSIANPCSVAVYRLPFWHYTTPLQAKRSLEKQARRWLLLASFNIKKDKPSHTEK